MKSLYKILAFVFGVSAGIAAGLVFFLLTPAGVSRTAKGIAQWRLKELRVDQLTVGDVRYRNGEYLLKDARAVLRGGDDLKEFSLDIGSLKLERPLTALWKNAPLAVTAGGVHFESPAQDISAHDFLVKAAGRVFDGDSWSGTIEGAMVKREDYRVDNPAAAFKKNSGGFVFTDVTGDFYGGRLTGKIVLETTPGIRYDTILYIEGLDVGEIADLHPAFQKIRGRLRGTFRTKGSPGNVEEMTGSLTAEKDGQIQASLLEPLLKYIPQTQQKTRLQAAIAGNGLLPLQKANVELNSVDNETLITRFDLKSKEYNLDLDLTVELNVEGGLNQLLNLGEHFFKRSGL